MFIGRTDAEAETTVLWPPHAKSWLIGKDSDDGRDCGHGEEGTTEDEMAGRHHRLYGHEFEWTIGVGDGQRGLVWCDSWVAKSRTQRSDWTELLYPEMVKFRDKISAVFLSLCVNQPVSPPISQLGLGSSRFYFVLLVSTSCIDKLHLTYSYCSKFPSLLATKKAKPNIQPHLWTLQPSASS